MTFTRFDVSGDAKVSVYDDQNKNKKLQEFSESHRPSTVINSTGSTLFITFDGGIFGHGKGFNASYISSGLENLTLKLIVYFAMTGRKHYVKY